MADAIVVAKTCRKCGAEFSGKECKVCRKARAQAYYAKNRAHTNRKNIENYYANKPARLQQLAEYREQNRERLRANAAAFYEANAERLKAEMRASHAENREARNARKREWAAANKDIKRKRAAAYEAANREKLARYRESYWERNGDRLRENGRARYRVNKNRWRVYRQNRLSRIRANGGELSSDIVERLLKLQRGKCACCGKPLGRDYHLDHIVPLARGGENSDQNAQLLTAKCNRKKSAKDPTEFMQSRGFLL